jgi:hypothetical protein
VQSFEIAGQSDERVGRSVIFGGGDFGQAVFRTADQVLLGHGAGIVGGTVQRLGGSGRRRQLLARSGDRIEQTAETGAERAIIDRATDLEEQVGASPRPSHLL